MSTREVAIIGAGPYGLAAAAHLRARGVDTHVFGRELEFWRRNMPIGMLLRSGWEACTISDPHDRLTLDAYQAWRGRELSRPVPLEDFLDYGAWYQRQAVPDLDRRRVVSLEPVSQGFRLVLEDDEAIVAGRVVVATGLAGFGHRPARLATLSAPLAFHSSDLRELGAFAGRRVLVVGGGQSAVELAALLHEAGAEVEIVLRAPGVHWLSRSAWLHQRSGPLRPLLYPRTDVGPPGLSLIVAHPDLFRRLPLSWQEPIARRSIRPAAAAWLPERVAGMRITSGRTVESALPAGDRLRLRLDDGTDRLADHLVLATGYHLDLGRHPLLRAPLLDRIARANGVPLLGPGFESSMPGLHFLGGFAAYSFGPVMRFVSGTRFAARALAAHIARRTRPGRTSVGTPATAGSSEEAVPEMPSR